MNYLREEILATLAYYDVLEYPLTVEEIQAYLINPQRLFNHTEPLGETKLVSLHVWLQRMVKEGAIGRKWSFYFLPGREELVTLRIEKEKISAQKWKKIRRVGYWFQLAPFVRAVWVSGSMAIDNANKDSDLDVLVIAKADHLYLARIFISLIASIFNSRRTRYEHSASNKFCFNHYLTDDSLFIPNESLYNAQTYASLKPILGSTVLYRRFYAANFWINKYMYNFRPNQEENLRQIRFSVVLFFLSRTGEGLINLFGNLCEGLARWYQQRRIKLNPATYQTGGRIVCTDQVLEFHPRSFERVLLERYNKKICELCGPLVLQERDSGLTAD